MTDLTHDVQRERIREHYSEVAQAEGACGCGPGCCGGGPASSLAVGYTQADLAALPAGVDMGLGCGTPLSFASLREGEVVLDLGSGGGIDAFLAAAEVGPTGRVVGVDMTSAMLDKARRHATRVSASNVEFKLGEIEAIPLPDRSVDVVISNCVINLSLDKPAVFREAFRVLRPGGRLALSDIVSSAPLTRALREDPDSLAGCIAGAPSVDELDGHLRGAGFADVHIDINDASRTFIKNWNPGSGAEQFVVAAAIRATRPAGTGCCGSASKSACC